MSLLDAIKSEQIEARKQKTDKVKISLLTTVIGDVEAVGKKFNRQSTDEDVISILKKFINNLNDNLGFLEKYPDETKKVIVLQEKSVLESFLPKQLSEDELRKEISTIVSEKAISGPKGMGLIMKSLVEKFPGLYDGNLASKLAKEILAV